MITQMTQPVKREYNVLLERYASGSSFTSKVGFLMKKIFQII